MAAGTVLITGAAGFIGYHIARRLLEDGRKVVGVDNLDPYYDPILKEDRWNQLEPFEGFSMETFDIAESERLRALFERERPSEVVHLAAQAGVRYSLENPDAYARTNVVGFLNVLEACRAFPVNHLVAASSSSVYGTNARQPLSESHNVDHPVSLYAATKKADELMAHAYSHLYRIPVTCLRFFTVYGPWGRPDMAYFSFTKAILEDRPIPVFNHGRLKRDFTYVDDIVEGVFRVLNKPANPAVGFDPSEPDPARSSAPYRVFNIGNNRPVELMEFIRILENCLGRKAKLEMLPMQPGDVLETCADIEALREWVRFAPSTKLEKGLEQFVAWYREYYEA